MFGFLSWWFLIYITLYENANYTILCTKTKFYKFRVVDNCISLDVISVITLKILNPRDKSPKIFALHIFGLKCCLHPYNYVKAVQDVISLKTVRLWLHNAVYICFDSTHQEKILLM